MRAFKAYRWLLHVAGCEHHARLCRRSFRRGLAAMKYGSLRAAPILFGNSFPKSGTFLLKQVLVGFTYTFGTGGGYRFSGSIDVQPTHR
jgi:hypothetical protein